MKPFTERVVQLIRGIPPGRVMTYGQIAALAGSPRGARQVVRILHAMSSKHQLPWHRVINAQGIISIPDPALSSLQIGFLQAEGIDVMDGRRVDLHRYQYHPEIEKEESRLLR